MYLVAFLVIGIKCRLESIYTEWKRCFYSLWKRCFYSLINNNNVNVVGGTDKRMIQCPL